MSSDREREKIIQSIPKSSEDSEDPNSLPKTDSQSKQNEEEVNNKPLPSNTIPFPSTQPETAENVQEITNETRPKPMEEVSVNNQSQVHIKL